MNFRDHLISTYYENPCQVLPNAIWKTLVKLENMETTAKDHDGVVVELKVTNKNMLMTYWTRDRQSSLDSFQHLDTLNTALIHQDFLRTFPFQRFPVRTPYFRLIHRHDEIESQPLVPTGFSIVEVNIQQEHEEVAHFIGECYQNIHPTADTVLEWSRHPTFDLTLWIWVVDNAKGRAAGLGIAEIDTDISEGSLEWIQLLPNYRGMGLGKVIVQELLYRLGKRARFTTVSGETENKGNPEALYRSCGFKGNDIWWMCRTE